MIEQESKDSGAGNKRDLFPLYETFIEVVRVFQRVLQIQKQKNSKMVRKTQRDQHLQQLQVYRHKQILKAECMFLKKFIMQLQVLLVHHYFGSKEELMVALIQQQAQQVLHLLFRDYQDWVQDLLQESRHKGLAKMNHELLGQFMNARMD